MPQEETIVNEPKISKTVSDKDLTMCNFRLRDNQIRALGILYVETHKNVSGMVREALEMYLSDYFEDKTVNLRIFMEGLKTPENAFETKGIRLNQRIIEAVRIVAAFNGVNKSELVRNAIDEYLKIKDAE